MKTYCLVCRENTENKDVEVINKTKNGRLQMRSQY